MRDIGFMNSDEVLAAAAIAESCVADGLANSVGELSNLIAVELIALGADASPDELDIITDAAANVAMKGRR